MPHINKSALIEYSAEQMYQLVNDIARYHEFLPWCSASAVETISATELKGSISISKGAINQTFTTHNTLQKNRSMSLTLVDGPFKSLHGEWRFTELSESASKVELDLNYEFSSKMLAMMVGPVFEKIANTMVDSFVERANAVYA